MRLSPAAAAAAAALRWLLGLLTGGPPAVPIYLIVSFLNPKPRSLNPINKYEGDSLFSQ